MKPYLFLSGLLLGTSISMSSLMADTHVVDGSCNDARYGACTSLDIKHEEPTGKIPLLLGNVAGFIIAIPVCALSGLDRHGDDICIDMFVNSIRKTYKDL